MRKSTSIKVVCRFRPLNKLELSMGGETCVVVRNNSVELNLSEKGERKHNFQFDTIFPSDATQCDIFEVVGKPVLEHAMEGYNGTIFAYGQTSSGKTFTMEGPNLTDEENRGIIPRVMDHTFMMIGAAPTNFEFTVSVQMLEIYNEKIRDLLDPKKNNLNIKSDPKRGLYVDQASEVYVASAEEMKQTMILGSSNRAVASTRMNAVSSRSHLIFMIKINKKDLESGNTSDSKLYFVDLAGSEKMSKTEVSGKQLDEAKNINKSLTTLGLVINALVEKSKFVPYRNSKLTRMLQESIGGNSLTTLVIAASMCSYNEAETLSTLLFGQRAKSIENKAVANVAKSAAELQRLLDEALEKLAKYEQLIKKLGASDLLEEVKGFKNDLDSEEVEKFSVGCQTSLIIDDDLKLEVVQSQQDCIDQIVEDQDAEFQATEEHLEKKKFTQGHVEQEGNQIQADSGEIQNLDEQTESEQQQAQDLEPIRESSEEGSPQRIHSSEFEDTILNLPNSKDGDNIDTSITPNIEHLESQKAKTNKKSTLVNQALTLINKNLEIKRLTEQIKNMTEDNISSLERLNELQNQILKVEEQNQAEKVEIFNFLEELQGQLELDMVENQQRNNKMTRLCREIDEMHLKLTFLSNDSGLVSNQLSKIKGGDFSDIIERMNATQKSSQELIDRMEEMQTQILRKEAGSTKESFHIKAVKNICKFLEGNRETADVSLIQTDINGDDDQTFLRNSILNFDLGNMLDNQEGLDLSKINKVSHNTTIANSDCDKDLLEVIESDQENEEGNEQDDGSPAKEYRNLLTEQKNNITSLYTRISKLENQLEKFKKMKEEISEKAKEKIKELTIIGKNKITSLKSLLKQAKSKLAEEIERKSLLEAEWQEKVMAKSQKISKLETEIAQLNRVLTSNTEASNRLALENQIVKLASERQSFFNYKFDLERTIQEKEELLEEKNTQIEMMKEQLKILSKELDIMARRKPEPVSLIPKGNIVKKVRGGGFISTTIPIQQSITSAQRVNTLSRNGLPGSNNQNSGQRSLSFNKSREEIDKELSKATSIKQESIKKTKNNDSTTGKVSIDKSVLDQMNAFKTNRIHRKRELRRDDQGKVLETQGDNNIGVEGENLATEFNEEQNYTTRYQQSHQHDILQQNLSTANKPPHKANVNPEHQNWQTRSYSAYPVQKNTPETHGNNSGFLSSFKNLFK